MPNANIVILLGHAIRDPELTYTQSNIPICKWGLACNRKWKGADGQQHEGVLFVDCTAFRGLAEVISKYLRKGTAHYIQGYLKLDQWEDKEGNKRSKLSVVVDQFQLCERPQNTGNQAAPSRPAAKPAPVAPQGDEIPKEDDIPF